MPRDIEFEEERRNPFGKEEVGGGWYDGEGCTKKSSNENLSVNYDSFVLDDDTEEELDFNH